MSFNCINRTFRVIKIIIGRTTRYFSILKHKLNNLEKTNIDLAKRYLDNNRLNEAYVRLKIINLLWSNNIDGIYYYAVLLIFLNKKNEAIKILNRVKDNKITNKLLYIAENFDGDYILNIIKEKGVKLSELENVL